MTITLNIVERAYQGTLEEQDDQAVWLIQSLIKAGSQQAVLLRGPATGYAVRDQSVSLAIAGVPAGNPARVDQDLQQLAEADTPVWLVEEDARDRGITPEETIAGARWIPRARVAELFQQHDRIFAW